MTQLLVTRQGFKNISIGVLDEFMDWQVSQKGDDVNAFTADRYVADMYRAVTLRGLGVSAVPFRIESADGKTLTTSEDYEDVTGFLPKPKDTLKLLEYSRTLTGTFYQFKSRNRIATLGLRYLNPQTIKPLITEDGLQGFERIVNGKKKTLSVDDVVYNWMPDASVELGPPNRYPAQAAMSAAGIERNLDRFVELFFKRGAIKATIFTLEGNPPKKELDRMEEWAATWLTGLINAFTTKFFPVGKVNPLVVGEGVENLENAELEMAQGRKIAKAMLIPMAIFSSESSAGLGGGGVASQDAINFMKQCIIPECDDIAETWNEQVFVPGGYKWIWEYESLDEFHDDEDALASTMSSYADNYYKVKTYDEWEALCAMTGVEYDERAFKKIFAARELRAQETQAQIANAQAQQPDPANMTVSKPDVPQLTAGDNAKAIGGTNGLESTRVADSDNSDYFKQLRADSDSFEAALNVAKASERKQYERWKAKRVDGAGGKPFAFHYLNDSEQADLTGQKKTSGVKSVGSVSQRFQNELTALVNEAWLTQGGKITRDMNALVSQYVDDAFEEGLLDGGSTPEQMSEDDYTLVASLEADQTQYIAKFAKDVQDATTDPAQQESIRKRIVLWAESMFSIGQRGWATAQSKTKRRIQWHTSNDEATCPICAPLNDKIVEAGKPFAAGIYNEPAHPNCRCTTDVYLEASDYQ